MGMHASMIKKLRKAGYNQDKSDDAVKAFLEDNKDYSDKIVAEKIGVSEGAVFNWRKKRGLSKGDDKKSPYSGFETKLKKLGYEVGDNETLTSTMRKFLRNTLITSGLTIEQVAEKLDTTPDVIKFWIKRLSLEDEVTEKLSKRELKPNEPAKEIEEGKVKNGGTNKPPTTPRPPAPKGQGNKKIEEELEIEETLDLFTEKKVIEEFIEENAFNLGRKYMRQIIKGMYSELRDVLHKIK